MYSVESSLNHSLQLTSDKKSAISKANWSIGKLPSVRESSLSSSLLLFAIAVTIQIK